MTKALSQILAVIVSTVKAGGPAGVPGGAIYAALMTQGCTLEQFETLMGYLVRSDKVRKSGHLYLALKDTE